MVELKIPFLGSDNRELAELGRDTLSGSDWFWLQFFLIGIGGGLLPLALDYYLHYKVLGIDGLYWFAGAWFLAGIWAGGNKFWDDQKRNSPRSSSAGYEGTVRLNKGTIKVEPVTKDGQLIFPALRIIPEGVDHLIHWTPTRGVKIIERDDGFHSINGRHLISNTASKQTLWDFLPAHVQEKIRTHRKTLKVKFIRGDWRFGRPVLGTKFVYGDKPMYQHFMDDLFEFDTSAATQSEYEALTRGAAERIGVDMATLSQTASKHRASQMAKRIKSGLPIADEGEESEDRGLE